MDWRRSRDPHQASAQAENGSAGCATDPAFVVGRPLPADLGTELGESRSAATAVAPAPDGAGAHASHESTASGGAQRRPTVQEAVVGRGGTRATGGVPVSSVGEPETARSAGVAGPAESHDHGADTNHRAGSGEVS